MQNGPVRRFALQVEKGSLWERLYRGLGYLNNILIIPLFTLLILETGIKHGPEQLLQFARYNLIFCALFFTEWAMGLALSKERRAYLKDPFKILDLASSLPLLPVFQGLRVARLLRVLLILRPFWRARRRFAGKGRQLGRAVSLVFSTVFAGALAMRIVEPSRVEDFREALWWSIVTVSTVGYGDIAPETYGGKLVASVLILFGIGVFGYMAGFMSSIMADPDEDEILKRVIALQGEVSALRQELAASRSAEPPATAGPSDPVSSDPTRGASS